MKKSVRFVVMTAAAAAVLAASACTEVVNAVIPTWTSDGTFDYLAHDGGTTWGGGGPVKATVHGAGVLDGINECPPGPWELSYCSRLYQGTLSTLPGFDGEPGSWPVVMRTYRYSCTFSDCSLQIYLEELTTPDGTDGLSSGIAGEVIDGTDGCAGRGVKFEGTGDLISNPSIEVDVAITICSPGLAASMEATRTI